MDAAAERLFAVLDSFAAAGRPPLIEVLDGRPFLEWEHYPEHDLFDPASGVLVFYHAHSQGDRDAVENGHFHCFVSRSHMRRRARPIVRPGRGGGRALCHIAGVSVNAEGVPTELFTTNQPVTGEWLYPAAEVARLLPRFAAVPDDAPSVMRWLASLVTLFEPDIADLLERRDARLGIGTATPPSFDGLPDILSSASIDIDDRLVALGQL